MGRGQRASGAGLWMRQDRGSRAEVGSEAGPGFRDPDSSLRYCKALFEYLLGTRGFKVDLVGGGVSGFVSGCS